MEWSGFKVKKVYVVRVDPGEDVLECVERFIAQSGLEQAVVINGYGTLAAHSLHWVKHNRIPAQNAFAKGEGGIEILCMSGTVVEGKPHLHVTLSTREGAYGGHLEPGCMAYVLCELMMAEIEGAHLVRRDVEVNVKDMGQGTVPRLFFE